MTDRQRQLLFDLPDDEETLIRFYTLSDEDVATIRRRRRAHNQIGFALQLCAFRHPGRLLQPRELIPPRMLAFITAQLGFSDDDVTAYALRSPTRYEHSSGLQRLYDYKQFSGDIREEMWDWLITAAESAHDNFGLASAFLDGIRKRRVIVPAATTIERLCADALVEAERRIAKRIVGKLNNSTKMRLESLLQEKMQNGISKFVWLRQASPGANS